MGILDVLSKNLRAYRRESGMSQEKLAFEANLHRTYVSGIERGVRNPSVESLEKIARQLKVPVWKLLYDGKD